MHRVFAHESLYLVRHLTNILDNLINLVQKLNLASVSRSFSNMAEFHNKVSESMCKHNSDVIIVMIK